MARRFRLVRHPPWLELSSLGGATFHLLKVCDDTRPKHWYFNDNRLAGYTFLA
jgi:hypothetical protein